VIGAMLFVYTLSVRVASELSLSCVGVTFPKSKVFTTCFLSNAASNGPIVIAVRKVFV
jgi:hypothetical protein